MKMPELPDVNFDHLGDSLGDNQSLIIGLGLALVAFLIFRKALKLIVLFGAFALLFYLFAGH